MDLPPIHLLNTEPGARFAASELRRYLERITGELPEVEEKSAYEEGVPGLWLGLLGDFGESPSRGANPEFDDEIRIDVGPAGGTIAGPNSRSILLGAYRYLTELGCRWVRPGRRGESIPRLALPLPAVRVREEASYRHRGVCIEGAVSWDHVRDMVDWLPKLGFNGYYIQFREGYNFFQRWYQHEHNPKIPAEPFDMRKARTLTRKLREEIKRRDLILHMVGHGWTCEPFGIPGTGWSQHEGPIPEEAVPHLAEINGKRELFHGIALNTNLCYGNPETRAIVTDAIVEYAEANPDVDIIHFWLADGSNNQCECALCRDHRPSDLYVVMLNELDEKLTAAGLDTKIVFLAYVDLLWPPEKERIENPDRFILMFAPITRSYSTSFTAAGTGPAQLPPYVRNHLEFPRQPRMNLAFLAAWQGQFAGDGFDFDYHFMWDHYKDPAQYAMARVLHEDVRGLRDIGLNGFMSCQVQRAFFPTGLGMTVLGRTLWNRDLTFDEIAADYFAAAFGDQGERVREYLERLSDLFDPRILRGEGTEEEQQPAADGWRKVPETLEAFGDPTQVAMDERDAARFHSWDMLAEHGQLCKLLAAALAERHAGDPQQAKKRGRELAEWVREREDRLHPDLDVFEFLQVIGPLVGVSREELVARQ
jgi:hypothetical protein